MHWLTSAFGSSIGKKLMMAITGLSFCGFLAVHLAGNLTVYGGGDAFNAYSATLHSMGPMLKIAETGLIFFAMVHIVTGIVLFFENLRARQVRYHVKKNAGGQTIGSATMPYTGILLLAFVIIHLYNFSFVDKADISIFEIVRAKFANPVYIVLYIAGMTVVAVHVSHGFWSAFQTIGANHPKYMPFFRKLSIAFSLIVGIGFGMLPIYFALMA